MMIWEAECLRRAAVVGATPLFPLSLHLYDDSSALAMPAGSRGTLQELVWYYQRGGGGGSRPAPPEVVALYYTTIMIRSLLLLHHEARILHMDLKPDNWLLWNSSSSSRYSLALIDFGLAVDLGPLTTTTTTATTTTTTTFPVNDPTCPIREGGEEVDYYALASTAHCLLFGQHLHISSGGGGISRRGKGSSSSSSSGGGCGSSHIPHLRRYWQRELWKEFFDAALCGVVGGSSSSTSSSKRLEKVCGAMEEYLEGKREKLEKELGEAMKHLVAFKE